jgi:hypothetical protein
VDTGQDAGVEDEEPNYTIVYMARPPSYTTFEIALNVYPATEKCSIATGGLTVLDHHSMAWRPWRYY